MHNRPLIMLCWLFLLLAAGFTERLPGQDTAAYTFSPCWRSPRLAIPVQYKNASHFRLGYAVVETETGQRLIDTSGAEAVPGEFEGIRFWEDGSIYTFHPKLYGSPIGVFFPRTGWYSGAYYESATHSIDTLYWLRQNGRYGLLNDRGDTLLPFEWDYPVAFSEGLCARRENKRWGLVDTRNQWVVAPKFASIGRFREGLAPAAAYDKKGRKKHGMIDRSGAWVIPPSDSLEYGEVQFGFIVYSTPSGKQGLLDKQGNTIFPARWKSIKLFSEKVLGFVENDHWGLASTDGAILFPARFEAGPYYYNNAYLVQEGLIRVRLDGHFGFVDARTGRMVAQPIYAQTGRFVGGRAAVANDEGRWGAINWAGVFEPLGHSWLGVMPGGYLQYVDGKRRTIVDRDRLFAYAGTSPQYLELSEGWLVEPLTRGFRLIDLQSGLGGIFADSTLEMEYFADGRARVRDRRSGRYGFIENPRATFERYATPPVLRWLAPEVDSRPVSDSELDPQLTACFCIRGPIETAQWSIDGKPVPGTIGPSGWWGDRTAILKPDVSDLQTGTVHTLELEVRHREQVYRIAKKIELARRE